MDPTGFDIQNPGKLKMNSYDQSHEASFIGWLSNTWGWSVAENSQILRWLLGGSFKNNWQNMCPKITPAVILFVTHLANGTLK